MGELSVSLSVIFLLAWPPSSSCTGGAGCPPGWSDVTSAGLGCLLFSSKSMFWSEADQYCSSAFTNASLIEILTQQQMDFLVAKLLELGGRDWWAGGSDLDSEGDWRWTRSGQKVGDFVWASRQPDGGSSQNCLDLYSAAGFLGVDYHCDSSYQPICQVK